MSHKVKFHLAFTLITLAVASVISWLIVVETSPLSEYFGDDSVLVNFWRGLHLFPALASGFGIKNSIFVTTFIIQWLVIGLVLSFVVWRFRKGPAESLSIK